jgi:hypothetical protein
MIVRRKEKQIHELHFSGEKIDIDSTVKHVAGLVDVVVVAKVVIVVAAETQRCGLSVLKP